jgi:hypothetical protein
MITKDLKIGHLRRKILAIFTSDFYGGAREAADLPRGRSRVEGSGGPAEIVLLW